jgi:flagellar motor switch protein FliM
MWANDAQSAPPPEVRDLDLTGKERQLRGAVEAMESIAHAFARSAKRSLPFLTRYRARIVPTSVALLPPMPADAGPTFVSYVAGSDGAMRGAVTLDASALALIIEGVLGGAIAESVNPLATDLTAAQRALMARIGRSLALDLASAVRSQVGLAWSPVVQAEASSGAPDAAMGEALFVVCEIEGLPLAATITIQASAESLETAARQQDPEEIGLGDPHVAQSLLEVPVEVVAELGRVSVGVGSILKLRPGDIIRLPTATDDPIHVYAAGVHKFDGVPITSRGQFAIEIRSRSEA